MSAFLQWIEARRYGALADRKLGPFAPGLNAVYGPNETGKTSFASLVGAILFGWNDRHGVSNTYRPEVGERSGALVFRPRGEGDGAVGGSGQPDLLRLERSGSSPLEGDASLVQDIDLATYRTLFSLTSDELLSLRDSSDVTARLLAAGSGTSGSPVQAFVGIEQQIAALTAPDGDDPRCIPALEQRLDGLRSRIREASREVELAKQDARDLRELRRNRADAADRIAQLNRDIEELAAARDRVESYDERLAALAEEREQLEEEQGAFREQAAGDGATDPRLLALSSVQERTVRSRIDEYETAWEKMQRIVDTAKQNRASSQASYEAFLEMGQESPSPRRRLVSKGSQVAVSVIPTLAFIAAGIALFIHGRHIGSLSFTALGTALIILAFLLAAAGAVLLLRPDRHGQSLDSRRQDAQWVMLQDKKKLDGTLAEADQLHGEIAAYMDEVGLGDAEGSLRQARLLMDEAAQLRTDRAAADQRLTALGLRIRANRQEAQDIADRRTAAFAVLGDLPRKDAAEAIEAVLRAKSEQREALQGIASDFDRRIGEAGQRLDRIEASRELDALKLECQQVRTRLRESKHQLVELLLAKRMLERSMALWESTGKPQVYREAGQLLSLITGGRWTGVSLAATGSIVARDAGGNEVKPRHLSLGTCQQLYLALRIAMLLNTDAVGRSIPVLADDILVNFDGERRAGAAEALARLARKRQVIVFTCHRETVEALARACPDLRTVEL